MLVSLSRSWDYCPDFYFGQAAYDLFVRSCFSIIVKISNLTYFESLLGVDLVRGIV